MPHEDEARERMLRSTFTNQPLVLGMARDSVDDEETDAGYERVTVAMGEPQVVDGRVFVTNLEDVQMPAYAQDAEKPLKFWMLFDARGNRMAYDRITRPGVAEPRPVLPMQGEAPVFPAGEIKVGLR